MLSAVISRSSRAAIISAALWACFEIMFGVEVYFFRFHHWPKKTREKKIQFFWFFALRIVTSDAVYFWAQTQTLQCNLLLSPFNPSLRLNNRNVFANTGWVVFGHTYVSIFFPWAQQSTGRCAGRPGRIWNINALYGLLKGNSPELAQLQLGSEVRTS